jgi:hydroxypyruvate reductase
MVEALRPGMELEEMQGLTRRAFAEGWDIRRLNEERSSRSRLKGGGLARALGVRLDEVFVLSDVPAGQEAWVGSGPFWDGSVPHHIVGTRESAGREMREALARRGLQVSSGGELAGSVGEFSQSVRLDLEPGEAVVWQGELTLEAKGPGVGGRCQHLVLLLMERVARVPGLSLLAAGTDGRDGPTEAAGAWVDSAAALGSVGSQRDRAVADCDSYTFLAGAGLVIPRFDSGTNLNDLVVLCRD